MKLSAALLSSLVSSLFAVEAAGACPSIPGSEQIWQNGQIHWLLVGEVHGSAEAPEAFANLACDALAHGRQITVAVERPVSEQKALDAVLSDRNLRAAEQSLLAQSGWENGMDGRASVAMLRLLVSLRNLRHTHRGISVAAFDAPFAGADPGARDQAMGRALLEIGNAKPRNLILALTGNVHAMQAPKFGHDLAAMYLPAEETMSLEVTDTGGEAWVTFNGACGPSEGGVRTKGKNLPLGIYLDPNLAPYGKFDGILSLGVPLTSSPPAAGEPSPLPACWAKYQSENSTRH